MHTRSRVNHNWYRTFRQRRLSPTVYETEDIAVWDREDPCNEWNVFCWGREGGVLTEHTCVWYEQVNPCSRCSIFSWLQLTRSTWPKHPASVISAMYLLTISSPDINNVAMSLYNTSCMCSIDFVVRVATGYWELQKYTLRMLVKVLAMNGMLSCWGGVKGGLTGRTCVGCEQGHFLFKHALCIAWEIPWLRQSTTGPSPWTHPLGI